MKKVIIIKTTISELTEAFSHLTKDDLKRIITEERINRKAAVHFCEQWLNVTFEGNINDFQQVSYFLSIYLDEAKSLYDEVRCEYESYLWDLMMD